MDLKDIKAIIDLMKKNSVTEFELEKQDFKIRLKHGRREREAVGARDPACGEPARSCPCTGAGARLAGPSRAPGCQQQRGDQVTHDRHLLPGTFS